MGVYLDEGFYMLNTNTQHHTGNTCASELPVQIIEYAREHGRVTILKVEEISIRVVLSNIFTYFWIKRQITG